MERNIKFRYYKLEQQHKEKNKWHSDGSFDFIAWLDKVENNNLLTTTVELNDTKARVEKIKYYDKNQLWVLRFMKLRDENIPTIAKENNEAEDIPLNDDEYIGEDVYVLYDECNKIAMVQSNRFSLGTERLAEYMNKILNNDNKMRVKMKPIMKEINISKLKGKKYKTIELGFANIISDVPNSKSSLSSIMNTYRKFHGVSGHISISLGRTKGDTLNIVEIENLLNEVPEYDNIVSAKIRVKDDDSEHMEWVDLFDNLMQDVIPFHILKRSSIGFDYAANNMIDCYTKRQGELINLTSCPE